MELMILAKVLVAVGVIMGLAWVAERVGPDWAGVLTGFPLGTAILLFFYGIEQGPEFAAAAAYYGLLGQVATTGFATIYTLCAHRMHVRSWWPMGLALLGLLAAASLGQAAPALGRWGALIALIGAVLAIGLTRHIPESQFAAVSASKRMLWARAMFAAGLVVLITALANVLPHQWAGVMASFPLTLLPLMLLMQLNYDNRPAMILAKHFPYGLGSLILYTLGVAQFYPWIGIGLGTLSAFALAGLYLGLFSLWHRRRGRLRAAPSEALPAEH
ncbi:hypothetical protein [Ferrimonas pelagia]|uniref:Uncharacterized protein n=1 Tax=Ferrimonas pelagia TaxID=1177826 RepID=A0ABP9F3R8_9GAMM